MIDLFIERWRSVLLLFALIISCGIYSYINIPKESDPDIPIPIIYVSISHEGISPDDAERLLLKPLEKELSSIDSIKEIKSQSYLGGGYVMLEFDAGFDSDTAIDNVREAVDKAKAELPEDSDEPMVKEVNIGLFPILIVTISGDVPERTLIKLANNVQDKIESIQTVLEAKISGDREELVEIIIDPITLENYGLNGVEILQFFNQSNKLVAAGNIDNGNGRFAIEVPGLFESHMDILEMPLLIDGDSVIKVKDIATIRKTFKDRETYARTDGKGSIAIEVIKKPGENIIQTIKDVKSIVAQESKLWNENISVTFSQDRSENITTMLKDLQNNIISAILLVMIVLIATLGVRSAVLVGIAIPGAFLSGILIINMMGLTINIVVLFSLILSVGMLVDGAIVVSEYAERKISEGYNRQSAFSYAARRMAIPITASTITTLAAFAPLLFWPDIVGEFMKYMPITMLAVLSSSLVVALIFIPVIGAKVGLPIRNGSTDNSKKSEEYDIKEIKGFTGLYVKLLTKLLNIPFVVIGIALILLFGVQFLYSQFGKGVQFFPNIEPRNAVVMVHARGNLSIEEKNSLVTEVEEKILDINDIRTIYTIIGKIGGGGSDLSEDVIGQIQVEFKDWDERRTANEILDEIKLLTSDIAGIYVETQKEKKGPQSGKDIQIEISSHHHDLLPIITNKIVNAMKEDANLIDIEDSRPLPGIQWEVDVDRAEAAKYDLDITVIGFYIKMVTNGLKAADYRPNDSDDEIDIVIRHSENERTLSQLYKVKIETKYGSVPLMNFASISPVPAVGKINRVNQKRVINIKANVKDGININDQIIRMNKWLEDNSNSEIADKVDIKFKGDNEKQQNSQNFLINAFMVAIFVMAIILITQFNSAYHAFLILSAVIMSTTGVMLGLLITGQPFGIVMTGVGVIALAGIIVNNNIVLIDTFHYLKKQNKYDIKEIILRTGLQRLRPVLLTSVTTIFGLLPMVLQLNIDFIEREISIGAPSTQWWVQLSTAIAFGLSFSTILTLIVTPCALIIPSKIKGIFKKLTGAGSIT